MKPILLVLAILTSSSAAQAETIKVWIDPALNDRQEDVWAGLRMWQDVCDVKFVREKKESKARLSIHRRDSMEKAGVYYATNLYINTTYRYTHHTVAHEIGHWILGPSHSDNPSDIMYYQTNARQRISRQEAARAVARFGEPKQ